MESRHDLETTRIWNQGRPKDGENSQSNWWKKALFHTQSKVENQGPKFPSNLSSSQQQWNDHPGQSHVSGKFKGTS